MNYSEKIFEDFWHSIEKSKYRVERAFNALSIKERKLVFIAGELSRADLISPELKGNKFADFTDKGRLKIVEGIHFLKSLANETLPQSVSKKEAFNLDPKLNNQEMNKVA